MSEEQRSQPEAAPVATTDDASKDSFLKRSSKMLGGLFGGSKDDAEGQGATGAVDPAPAPPAAIQEEPEAEAAQSMPEAAQEEAPAPQSMLEAMEEDQPGPAEAHSPPNMFGSAQDDPTRPSEAIEDGPGPGSPGELAALPEDPLRAEAAEDIGVTMAGPVQADLADEAIPVQSEELIRDEPVLGGGEEAAAGMAAGAGVGAGMGAVNDEEAVPGAINDEEAVPERAATMGDAPEAPMHEAPEAPGEPQMSLGEALDEPQSALEQPTEGLAGQTTAMEPEQMGEQAAEAPHGEPAADALASDEKRVSFADQQGEPISTAAAGGAEQPPVAASEEPPKKKGVLGGFFSRFGKKKEDQVPGADAAAQDLPATEGVEAGEGGQGQVAEGEQNQVGEGWQSQVAEGEQTQEAAGVGEAAQGQTEEQQQHEEGLGGAGIAAGVGAGAVGAAAIGAAAAASRDSDDQAIASEEQHVASDDQAIASDEQQFKEGAGWKPGKMRHRILKQRTFRLWSDGRLQWTRTEWKKNKEIKLSAAHTVQVRDTAAGQSHPHILDIVCGRRRHTLRFDSAEDRDSWADAIKKVIVSLGGGGDGGQGAAEVEEGMEQMDISEDTAKHSPPADEGLPEQEQRQQASPVMPK